MSQREKLCETYNGMCEYLEKEIKDFNTQVSNYTRTIDLITEFRFDESSDLFDEQLHYDIIKWSSGIDVIELFNRLRSLKKHIEKAKTEVEKIKNLVKEE